MGYWPIADWRVPNNNPRNTCGTHFGSSPLLAFKATYLCQGEQKVVNMLIILHYFSQQLSKYTDAGHPDSFHIENALETMKQMINILNDSIQSSCKLAHNTQTRRSFKKRYVDSPKQLHRQRIKKIGIPFYKTCL